ncbi:SCO family protein [Mangrovibacterium lignilyticum]|uniref:SCO family protein n=1 Tax=Mangrovibacterium lignilyticum TaxID=2668052 RepID=UPI0013D05C4C|nr:SCO family protein [Mangrovibacterium lignilyticum]
MIGVKKLNIKLITGFLFFVSVIPSFGQNVTFDGQPSTDPEIGVVEHLDEFLPKDIYITGIDSQTVVLTDLIDKPTIINYVYFRCPGICSPLMEGLAEVMDKSDLVPGVDYQVLTISFDPTETLDLALRKKTNYLNLVTKKEQISNGWKFFVSDSASIAKGTNAVGFKYKRQGNDFLHAASVMVISPNGKITRYLNGLYFLPFEFKMAIIEANKGQSAPTINKILQFCYSYDPVGQTYVLNVTKVAGTLILFIALILFLFLIFKPKTKKK